MLTMETSDSKEQVIRNPGDGVDKKIPTATTWNYHFWAFEFASKTVVQPVIFNF